MAKRIASCVSNINDFPDEVLCRIISLLPFKEAVRTSVLSTRWRYLFFLLSSLDLEMDMDGGVEKPKRFMNFVDRLLFYRDIPSVEKFHLRVSYCIDFKRVGVWLSALVLLKIQELELRIAPKYLDFPLPPNLFCSETLVVLKFDMHWNASEFKFPKRICLPNLKVLHLVEIVFPIDGSEKRLFSGCPVLEDLVVTGRGCFIRGCNKFSVSNQNLKTLTLKVDDLEARERPVRILINAPSLVLLNYKISEKQSIVLKNVKSLAEAIFDSGPFCPGVAPGVLSQIQNVRAIGINYPILFDLKSSGLPIFLFTNAVCLKIQDGFDPICLEYFLARCVVLETLVFEDLYSWAFYWSARHKFSMRKSRLAPLLCHLKTIEIHLPKIGDAEYYMAIIEFFLENARVLEELKIYAELDLPEQQVEMMKKVTSFPRLSMKCRVLF